MNRRAFLSAALGLPAVLRPESGKLASSVTIGREIAVASPPKNLAVRESLGIVCHESINGQVIHRTRKETIW